MAPSVSSGFGLGGNFECLIFVTQIVQIDKLCIPSVIQELFLNFSFNCVWEN